MNVHKNIKNYNFLGNPVREEIVKYKDEKKIFDKSICKTSRNDMTSGNIKKYLAKTIGIQTKIKDSPHMIERGIWVLLRWNHRQPWGNKQILRFYSMAWKEAAT